MIKSYATDCILALVVVLGFAGSVSATDELRRYAELINQSTHSIAFEYRAPLGGFSANSGFPVSTYDVDLAETLLATEGADPVTGVDFGAVGSIITLGTAPNTVTILHGSPGYTDDMVAALSARGFDRQSVGDIAVYARGADDALDMNLRNEGDAFGNGLGQAQRIANPGDDLILTRNWATINHVLASRDARAKSVNPWRVAFDTLVELGGDNHLESALGWQDKEAGQIMIDRGLVPYRVAVITEELHDSHPILRMIMVYAASADEVEAATEALTAQLRSLAEALGSIELSLVERDGMTVAVVTMVPHANLAGAPDLLQQMAAAALGAHSSDASSLARIYGLEDGRGDGHAHCDHQHLHFTFWRGSNCSNAVGHDRRPSARHM